MPKHRESTKPSSKKATPYPRKANVTTDLSADASASEHEDMSLTALTENYMDHRDEVMQILFNLTKALKDEREFRQSLLKRLEALEGKQEILEKTQKEQTEKLNEHDRTLSEVDQNINDISCQWEDDLQNMEEHSEEQINEKLGQFVTRLDHVESGLQEMRRVQNATRASDPFAGSEDWDSFAHREDDDEIEVLGTSMVTDEPAQAQARTDGPGHVPSFIRSLQKKNKSRNLGTNAHAKAQRPIASKRGGTEELPFVPDSSPSPNLQPWPAGASSFIVHGGQVTKPANTEQAIIKTVSSERCSPIESPLPSKEHLSPSLFFDVDAAADRERICAYLGEEADHEEQLFTYIRNGHSPSAKSAPPTPNISPSALYEESAAKWDWERIVANADLSGYSRG